MNHKKQLRADKEYPKKLVQIIDPPIVLIVRGENDTLLKMRQSVAVVGTRQMTVYGRDVCQKIVSDLAGKGIVIVSGMAKGIDTAVHQTVIDSKGTTIAVLGTGIDVINHITNYRLYRKIVSKSGLIVSEYPP